MSWTATHLRTLIGQVGRLLPPYWPNESANDDYVVDFKRGWLTKPIVPEGKTVLEAIMDDDDVDFAGGPPLSDDQHEEHLESVLKFLGETVESLANLYERHKPDAMQDPHDTAVRRKLKISGEEHPVTIYDDPKNHDWITIVVEGLENHTSLALYEKDDELYITATGITNFGTMQQRERQADVDRFKAIADLEGPVVFEAVAAEDDEEDVITFYQDGSTYRVSAERMQQAIEEYEFPVLDEAQEA